MVNFKGGEKVTPHDESMKILNGEGKNPILNNEINITQHSTHITEKGVEMITRKGNSKRSRMMKYNLAV